MAWIPDGTPAGAISPEVGAPIAEGGAMQGPGTHVVNATPVPVAEGVVYELTAPASGGAAVHWEVEVSAGGETWVERDGFGIDGEQSATDAISGVGTSVRVWRAPVDGVARFSVVINGEATITAPSVAPRTGRVVLTVPGDVLAENIMASGGLIAGDPDGARVVVDAEGVVAFDSSGTETAQITGEGGEFVGGSFRTSDNLPGQVTLADDAYVSSFDGVARPGISVEPEDSTRYSILPGVGPESVGMTIDGGKLTTGEFSYITMFPNAATIRSHRTDGTIGGEVAARPDGSLLRTYREDGTTGGAIQTSPTASLMRTYREDGTTGGAIQTSPTSSLMRTYSGDSVESGWVRVQPQDAELAYVAPDNTYFSRIKADASEAFLYTRAGGTNRYLTVDADGIWASTNKGGSWKHYNLEETAQDSGWQTFGLEPGVTGSQAVGWRNKGGVIFFRGFVTGDWTTGVWNVIASGLNPDWCPSATWVVAEAGGATKGATMQMTADGRLRISPPVTSTTSYYLNAMTYPAG